MRISTIAVLLAAQACCHAMAAADDWPQFRGPTGQGHSAAKGLPLEWTATENVVWKQPLPGASWSSPAVYQDRIYLTTAVAAAEAEWRTALETWQRLRDGEELPDEAPAEQAEQATPTEQATLRQPRQF